MFYSDQIITSRNEVVAKVMFSQASVILLTGGVYLVPGGVLSPGECGPGGCVVWGQCGLGGCGPGGVVWGE